MSHFVISCIVLLRPCCWVGDKAQASQQGEYTGRIFEEVGALQSRMWNKGLNGIEARNNTDGYQGKGNYQCIE